MRLIPARSKARRASVSRRVNYFLTKLMTGNNSGALLLTTFVLKPGAAAKCFEARARQLSSAGEVVEAGHDNGEKITDAGERRRLQLRRRDDFARDARQIPVAVASPITEAVANVESPPGGGIDGDWS